MDAREYRLFVWVLDNISASGRCGVCVCASALSLSCMLAFEDCIHACVCAHTSVCVHRPAGMCMFVLLCVCSCNHLSLLFVLPLSTHT